MKQQGMNNIKVCELCHGEASLFCESDSAFLCWNCDVSVHQANFLVARHVRLVICSSCNDFDGNRISGAGTVKPLVRKPICLSCSSNTDDESDYENDDDYRDHDSVSSSSSGSDYSCLSSSSACTAKAAGMSLSLHDFDRRRRSSARGKIQTSVMMKIGSVTDVSGDGSSFPVKISGRKSSENRKPAVTTTALRGAKNSSVDVKAEGILVNWCDKLGLKLQSGGGPRDSVQQVASHAFGVCLEKLSVLPLRVALAASLWFSIKHCCFGNNNVTRGRKASVSTCQMLLKRVEVVTGVPAKLIALGESRIYRVLNQSRRSLSVGDLKEGWAECSD